MNFARKFTSKFNGFLSEFEKKKIVFIFLSDIEQDNERELK